MFAFTLLATDPTRTVRVPVAVLTLHPVWNRLRHNLRKQINPFVNSFITYHFSRPSVIYITCQSHDLERNLMLSLSSHVAHNYTTTLWLKLLANFGPEYLSRWWWGLSFRNLSFVLQRILDGPALRLSVRDHDEEMVAFLTLHKPSRYNKETLFKIYVIKEFFKIPLLSDR